MNIGPLDLEREVLLIAEIGNNHEGSLGLAETLIGLAAESGAHAVKFQGIVPEDLIAPDQSARLEQLRRFALSLDQYRHLAKVADRAGVLFLCTPFSLRWVQPLADLCPALKIASSDNDFVPLLQLGARTGKPLLLSTGMADLSAIAHALSVIESEWRDCGIQDPGVILMHCVSAYPTPPDQANLLALRTLATLNRPVGYSDHTQGIAAAVLAVALGARAIEKHFTLSKEHSAFRDHQLSADPTEFRELAARVKEARALLGDGDKRAQPAEQGTLSAARRSIVAARALPAGQRLAMDDLHWLRPGDGLRPGQESLLLGRALARSVPAGHRLTVADLE
jgi:N,N'-diacetyllegionaminate synthase